MKNALIGLLHVLLGYNNYLRIFTRFKIVFLRFDRRKADFLFFERSIAADATILVIGANTGITTIPLAKNKPQRQIFAYEPVPSNFEVLQYCKRIFKCPNIRSYMIALGNSTGRMNMVLPVVGGAKKHGMAFVDSDSVDAIGQGESFQVQMDSIDRRSELNDVKVDAIKLVAENYECEILQGSEGLISRHKPLIYCELWPNNSRHQTLDLIRTFGYGIYYRKGDDLLTYDGTNYKGKNFFFRPME